MPFFHILGDKSGFVQLLLRVGSSSWDEQWAGLLVTQSGRDDHTLLRLTSVNAHRDELGHLSFLLKAATEHEKFEIHGTRKKEPKLWR